MVTKIQFYDKDNGISKFGFSKMQLGQRAIVIGYPDKKDKTLLVSTRVLVFPDFPKNPKIIVPEPSAITTLALTGEATPSTASAKKSNAQQ